MNEDKYNFTNNWFESVAREVWDSLIPQIKPSKILEIGSYEGASTCYLIDKITSERNIELHCIDTWEGGEEHKKGGNAEVDMSKVESRFQRNTKLAIDKAENSVQLTVHKESSDTALSKLISQGRKRYFDFIYVDGSHQASDVLCDAVLSFKLLKINGVIAFDDYLWQENFSNGNDLVHYPKPAIDAFTNIFWKKIKIIRAPLYQLYIHKIMD